ncbi:porin [Achromobacter aloeverae]|uniref:Porin n=1 Tax=Achromobacter aloeverae TaxID=1750518 RepID=A0A4Q1HEG5_9BURK|nr:porin [Achromobacter aloeverae]RXN84642.1 porin [Achromobacter aloeverae]
MKKTLLAASLMAACTGAAHAESAVTLYGIIDIGVGYERIRGDGFHASRIGQVHGVASGSRVGLHGVEDLGDGLSAVFTMESGFAPTNGERQQGNRMFGRQSTLGLDSRTWGRIEFGRQINMASELFSLIDPFGTSYNAANMGATFGATNTMRLDNLAMYHSPVVGGFQLGVGYSFNADDTMGGDAGKFATADNDRALTAGLSYSKGPLFVAASYDRLKGTAAAAGGQSKATLREYSLGATYDLEVVKLAAAVGQTLDGWFVGQTLAVMPGGSDKDFGYFKLAEGFRATSTMVGLTVPVSNATAVFGSWQRADPNSGKLTGGDKTFNVYAIGATYTLSKRTNFYAYASYGDNYAFHDGVTDTAVVTGIRHQF